LGVRRLDTRRLDRRGGRRLQRPQLGVRRRRRRLVLLQRLLRRGDISLGRRLVGGVLRRNGIEAALGGVDLTRELLDLSVVGGLIGADDLVGELLGGHIGQQDRPAGIGAAPRDGDGGYVGVGDG